MMSSTEKVPAQLIDEIEDALAIGLAFWETEVWMRKTVGRGITLEALKAKIREDKIRHAKAVATELDLAWGEPENYVYFPDQPHGWVE